MTKSTSSKRRGLVAALMLPVFFLAGCVKIDMGVELHEDNTADMTMVVIDKSGMLFDPELGGGSCEDLASEMAADETEGVETTVEEIEEDGQKGCKITATGGDITDGLMAGITEEEGGIERDGDVFNISMPAIAGEEAPSEVPGMEFSFFVTFPGKVIESNGTVSEDGRTVTWSGDQANATMEASGYAVEKADITSWLLIGLGVLVLAGAVAAGVYFVRKNKDDGDNGTPTGTLPEWDGSSTVPAPSYTEDAAPQQDGYPTPEAPQSGYPSASTPPANNGGYPTPPANGGGLPTPPPNGGGLPPRPGGNV